MMQHPEDVHLDRCDTEGTFKSRMFLLKNENGGLAREMEKMTKSRVTRIKQGNNSRAQGHQVKIGRPMVNKSTFKKKVPQY